MERLKEKLQDDPRVSGLSSMKEGVGYREEIREDRSGASGLGLDTCEMPVELLVHVASGQSVALFFLTSQPL